MFWTVVFGVIVAVIILGIISAISQESPGCALGIVVVILLFALGQCAL